jgi:hypothetical protein
MSAHGLLAGLLGRGGSASLLLGCGCPGSSGSATAAAAAAAWPSARARCGAGAASGPPTLQTAGLASASAGTTAGAGAGTSSARPAGARSALQPQPARGYATGGRGLVLPSRKPAVKKPARHQWHYCAPDYDPMLPHPSQPLPPYAPPRAHQKDYAAVFSAQMPRHHRNQCVEGGGAGVNSRARTRAASSATLLRRSARGVPPRPCPRAAVRRAMATPCRAAVGSGRSTPPPPYRPPQRTPDQALPATPPRGAPPRRFRRGWAKQTKLADEGWKAAWLRARAQQERREAALQRRAEALARRQAWAEWCAARDQLQPPQAQQAQQAEQQAEQQAP